MINKKPISKPACINFSSGPCTKRPGWSVNSLDNALLGRSHRSKEGKIKLKDAIDKTIDILGREVADSEIHQHSVLLYIYSNGFVERVYNTPNRF